MRVFTGIRTPRLASPFARVGAGNPLRLYAMVGVIGATWAIFNYLTDGLFVSPRNLSTLAIQISVAAVLACGMTALLAAREIDLSAGSAVSLITVIAASLQVDYHMDTASVIVVTVLSGAGLGALQGSLVAFVGIPSFVVTLAGALSFRGIAFIISGARTVGPVDDSFGAIMDSHLSKELTALVIGVVCLLMLVPIMRSRGDIAGKLAARLPMLLFVLLILWVSISYLGLPNALLITGICAVVVGLAMGRTRFGRRIYAVGGNPEAARYVGIRRSVLVFQLFLAMGALYGVAGLMLTSRLGGAPPNVGLGLELDVISACIIGGVSLFGGQGTVQGALLGVILFGSLTSGMALLNITSNAQLLVKGIILTSAVWLDVAAKRGSIRG